MMFCCRFAACLACFFVIPIFSVHGENWPGWRGPRGDGTSGESNVPTRWNVPAGENLRWATPLAAGGHSSPIVWEDRIFVTGCVADAQERVLICLDRDTGRVLWQKTVLRAPLETKHALNSFASSTPAADGKLVFVSFLEVDGHTIDAPNVGNVRPVTPGKMAVAAYDFSGNRQWLVRPGEFISAHGYCASPVLFENLVIVNGDHDGESYVVALDKATGKEIWRTPRANKIRSYVTPLIRDAGGRVQMVFSGSLHVASLDPRTGKTYWTIDGPAEQFVASPVFDGEKFYLAGGFPTHHVLGIRPDGSGNVTDTHVAWHATNAKCYVPSPVLADGHLIVADDRGTANCFVAATGERLWQERLGSHYSGSLVTAAGLVYLTADDGTTKIIRPGSKLDVVAENRLGEFCYSSPAIAAGRIYFRSERQLICIGASVITSATGGASQAGNE